MPGLFIAGTKIKAGRGGIVARGNRVSNSSVSTTTEIAVLRLDDIPIFNGRAYSIYTTSLALNSTVASDVITARIRITTDGSTPGIASTQIGLGQEEMGAFAPAQPIIAEHYPGAAQTLSVLLTVARLSGTGNVTILGSAQFPISLIVTDLGVDPGDIGVDL